jgi:RNA 2',3'-cyclic 3'-phosphodiesterase
MSRLFIALDLPADIREDIANLFHTVPNARWTPLDQIHLTVQFIGNTDDGTYHKITESLASINLPRFSLALKGVGYFPPRKDPRILWVGIDKCDALMELAGRVEKALRDAGAKLENRKFHPHITIARFKDFTPVTQIAEFLAANALFTANRAIAVDEFCLYSSIVNPHGAIHTREATFALD